MTYYRKSCLNTDHIVFPFPSLYLMLCNYLPILNRLLQNTNFRRDERNSYLKYYCEIIDVIQHLVADNA